MCKITTASRINFVKTHHFETQCRNFWEVNYNFVSVPKIFWRESQFCLTVPKNLWSELQFCKTLPKIVFSNKMFIFCFFGKGKVWIFWAATKTFHNENYQFQSLKSYNSWKIILCEFFELIKNVFLFKAIFCKYFVLWYFNLTPPLFWSIIKPTLIVASWNFEFKKLLIN